jgi:heme A synthase
MSQEELGAPMSKSIPREEIKHTVTARKFRILVVVTLVILTVQGWFGDTVNIFYAPSSGITPPPFTLGGFLQTVESLHFPLIWHAFEGITLVVLSVVVFALSFTWSNARSVRICAGLGLLMVVSAAIGGFLFVMSGFSNGGNSAQMGGSFIGAYAFYFMSLYYARSK